MKNFVETMTWYSNQHFYFIPWNVDKFMVSKPSLYFQTTNTCRNYFNTIDLVQIHGFQTTQRWHFHSFQTILLFHTTRLCSSSLFGNHEKMRNHCFDPMKSTNSWYAHIVCAKTRIDNVSPLRMCSDGVRKLYGYHRFVNECNFLWDANNDFSTVYGMQTTSSSKVSCFEIITMQLNMVWKNESANFVWFWNHGFAQLLWYWNNLFMFAWFGK